jgi:hypothetical protein
VKGARPSIDPQDALRPWLAPGLSVVLVVAAGCNSLSGLSDLAYEGAAGGASAASHGAGGSGGAGGGGASQGGSGGTTCGANGTHLVVDDFNDNRIDGELWDATGTLEADALMRIPIPANSTDFLGIETWEGYDLSACHVHIELVTPPPEVPGGWAFQIGTSTGNRVMFEVVDGTELHMRVITDDAVVHEDDVTFDHAVHRWFRLEENGGEVFFQTSNDGRDWITRSEFATPSYVTNASVESGALVGEPQPAEITVEIDNVNALP